MKRVLALGAGLVAKPLIVELLRRPDVELTVAALDAERARSLVARNGSGGAAAAGRAHARELDVNDGDALGGLVAGADAVVSLLPAGFHPLVARHCVEHGVSLVTTSYVSDAMRALDAPARERGVLLLNECGLDPGIDHMMAVDVIRRVEREGGRVTSFVSYCGGLPAPESADNPLRYKMSWSPRGVLVAARSPVRFLRGGAVVQHPTPYLPEGPARIAVPGAPALEGYPNRDSVPYRAIYGLEHADEVLRGTLRYPGWCATMEALLRLGLLDAEMSSGAAPMGPSYCDLLDHRLPAGSGPLPKRIARFLELPEDHPVLDRLAWLGLFSQRPIPDEARTPLEALAALMEDELSYREGERDMIVLEHRFGVVDRDGGERTIASRLLVEGEAGDESAMARTVGLPAALACGLILDGEVDLTGVHIPIDPSIYRPVLAALAERGIEVVEEELS